MFTLTRSRLVLVALILVVLAGSIIFVALTAARLILDDYVGVQLHRVMDTTVIRELRHGNAGSPPYAISFVVPESWVYDVRTHINGPTLVFEYLLGENESRVGEDVAAAIFYVAALSNDEYKEERDNPWWSGVAASTDDTYFVWDMRAGTPSGLSEAEFEALAANVPAILESVELTPLD
ncbi:MAG: hypothetical protein GYB65_14100 [Chloroflexi bacterium]|nr:hypothetical protein [Chloroflexota bacterium]